ncbi:choice-of-anchor D domain-containing protein [Candidatus Binatus sp.]|uniref:choice-of-anchor D domain-containing protein n=1 Tax=Candidatus Binatus sp. TaxID=2811406 RepID=UPI003C58F252
MSSNLLVNGDFSLGTTGWSFPSTCFSLDPTTPAPNGAASLELTNPATCSKNPSIAINALKVAGGQVYTISGQIKTEDFNGASALDGAIFFLYDYNYSPVDNGTTDWTIATRQHVSVTAGKTASFRLQTYGTIPTGNAWFANLSVQQEIPPGLETFLLYPNYRGLMFSDRSQVATMDLTVAPPAGTSLSSLQVVLNATDASGNVVATQSFTPGSSEFTGTLDMSALPPGTYQLAGTLDDSSGNVLMTQSAYTIVKLDASLRSGMKAWIDPANLAHFIDGNPHFVLGIYDTTGFSYAPAAYVKELTAIAQAPINMIINYYITNAPTPAITAYTTAMQNFGMTLLPAVNDFYTGNKNFPTALAKEFGTDDQDQLTSDYAAALSSDPGVVGYYVQDEPPITAQPETFHQYSLLEGGDPSGFTLAVIDHPRDLWAWKDTIDVIGVDPYPLVLASGNDIAEVADWTRAAYQAGHGARPVWTVIQFFQLTVAGAWPTQQQLHDMSWMAIVEGATGLFYWSYGVRALYAVKDPAEKAALYQELINVTTEIKSLEPVLLSPDAPVITDNSAAGTVFTKTKLGADGTRYLFCYNYTAAPITADFTLAQTAASIIDYDTGASAAPDSSTTFSADFQPYQAHVYLISNSPPVATPISSTTPSPAVTPTATASPTPAVTATASATHTATPTATRTATATGSATVTPTPTLTSTATATATATPTTTPTATATPGMLSITPAKLKFGAQRLGTTSRARSLKIVNLGGAAVSITGMPVSGDFAETNTCGASLAAQASCTIGVTFKPTSTGKRTGSLPIHDDASNGPQIVVLTGKGDRR